MIGWDAWGFACERRWTYSWCNRTSTRHDQFDHLSLTTLARAVVSADDDDGSAVRVSQIVACLAASVSVVVSLLALFSYDTRLRCALRKHRSALQPANCTFAFAWSVIYATTLTSLVYQIANAAPGANGYTAAAATNGCFAAAWFLCAAWVYTFARSDACAPPHSSLIVATVCLLAGAASALTATVLESSWRSGSLARIVFVGIPYSLFAGWLVAASMLAVDVAVTALLHVGYIEHGETDDTPCRLRFAAALVLALAMVVAAVLLADPVLPLPLSLALISRALADPRSLL